MNQISRMVCDQFRNYHVWVYISQKSRYPLLIEQ